MGKSKHQKKNKQRIHLEQKKKATVYAKTAKAPGKNSEKKFIKQDVKNPVGKEKLVEKPLKCTSQHNISTNTKKAHITPHSKQLKANLISAEKVVNQEQDQENQRNKKKKDISTTNVRNKLKTNPTTLSQTEAPGTWIIETINSNKNVIPEKSNQNALSSMKINEESNENQAINITVKQESKKRKNSKARKEAKKIKSNENVVKEEETINREETIPPADKHLELVHYSRSKKHSDPEGKLVNDSNVTTDLSYVYDSLQGYDSNSDSDFSIISESSEYDSDDISSEFSGESSDSLLITLVEQQSLLYDKSVEEYYNTSAREDTWRWIAIEMDSNDMFDDYSVDESDEIDDSSLLSDFMSGSYEDLSTDEDYIDESDDLYIKRDDAKIYEVDDHYASFNSEDDLQIFELNETYSQESLNDIDDEECPQLVPIEGSYEADGEINKSYSTNGYSSISSISLPCETYLNDPSYDLGNQTDNTEVSIINCQITESLSDAEVESEHCENIPTNIVHFDLSNATILSVQMDLTSESEDYEPEARKLRKHVYDSVEESEATNINDNVELNNNSSKTKKVVDSESTHQCNNFVPVSSSNSAIDETNALKQVQLNVFNSIDSRLVLALVKSAFYFHGSLKVTLLAGRAEIFGYNLRVNVAETVHSPRGHSFVYIKPIPSNDQSMDTTDILRPYKQKFLSSDLQSIEREFNGKTDALIALERNPNNKSLLMIEKYAYQTVFPNVNALDRKSQFYSSEFILHTKFHVKSKKGLVVNPNWLKIDINTTSRIVVVGGKGVGKSTMVRHMINRCIDKFGQALLIDLDIGQSEIFLPQTVNATIITRPIFGPGYLETISPLKAILFGDYNVLLSPFKYITCVLELISYCQSVTDILNIPWIVNTMGYNRGFGFELLSVILKKLHPTDLIQIRSERAVENFSQLFTYSAINNFPFNLFIREARELSHQQCTYQLHVFNSIAVNSRAGQTPVWDISPKELRSFVILSKLGNILSGTDEWLTDVIPYEANLKDLKIILNDELNNENLLSTILNANLVYLCEDSTTGTFNCLGLGFIRAVDKNANKIYLLSTIGMDELKKITVLAICNIPLPDSIYLNQNNRIGDRIPYVYNTDSFVGSNRIAQISYRPDRIERIKHVESLEN